MLTATKESKGTATIIYLDGSIEETPPLDQVFGPIQTKEIQVSCKKVNRLNSAGVRSWIKFFEGLRNKGTQFRFFECSPEFL